MPIRRPAIQHSIRRPMYPGARVITEQQRLTNDIINMELGSATESGVRNVRKSSLKCYCRLRLKKLLRHGNWSSKETKQEINTQSSPEEAKPINNEINNDGEALESSEDASLIEESELDFLNYIVAPEINQEYLEMEIENLDNNLEYANPEFEAPGNYSNYFGMEIENPENKSEIDEETEEELQGNDELNVGYDHEQTIGHSHMLHTDDEHAQRFQENYKNAQMYEANEEGHVSDPNERLNTEILENIVINNANINHAEILRTIREMILLKRGISSSNVDSIENDTAPENNSNVTEQINGRDNILQANYKISNAKGIHNFDPKNNEPTTENTSTKTRETEKAPPFVNFKVPKQVTRLKKKKIKKQQPRFVLTHVIGGHIIQESNYAFPIREPVNQKTRPQSSNTEKITPEEVKEEEIVPEEPVPKEVKEAETAVQEEREIEELVPTEVQEEEVENVQEDGDSNPFTRLQQSTVKSWTVEDLSDHILKCNWGETASLLQDNEIDGATLFMVTKTQLMIIGVNEEHADVISEFVQSGPSKGN